MKTSLICLLLSGLAMSAAAVELVRNGVSTAIIAIPAEAPASVRFAADELQKHIRKATGAELAIKATGEDHSQPNVVKLGFGAVTAALGPFGFVINAGEHELVIAGRDDPLPTFAAAELVGHGSMSRSVGTLFGVYDFLDRELGVHFLWPGELGVHVPARPDLRFDVFTRTGEPILDFALFRMSTSNPLGWADIDNRTAFLEHSALWLIRHGFAARDMVRGGHAFHDYWEKYGRTNPDFFALLPDGTRRPLEGNPTGNFISMCVSNPALHDKIVENYAKTKSMTVSIAENDIPGLCRCPGCRAWDTAAKKDEFARHPYWGGDMMPTSSTRFAVLSADEGGTVDAHFASVTDRYARFYNAVYDRLRQVNPKVRVCVQAYANFQAAPIEVKLNPNIYVGYVGWPSFPYTASKIAAARREFDAWRESGASITTRPNVTHVGANLPLWFARKIGQIYRQDLHAGIKGIDFDSLLGEYAVQGPSYYMLARLTKRPDLTVEAILDEYWSAFGTAGAAVAQYFAHWEGVADAVTQEQWNQWTAEVGSINHKNWQNAAHLIFTPEHMRRGFALLEAAAAAAGDPECRDRVHFLRQGLQNAQLTLDALAARRAFEASGTPENKSRWLNAIQALKVFRAENEGLFISDVGQRWRQEFYYSKLYPKE